VFLWQWQRGFCLSGSSYWNAVCPNGPGDVLDLPLAQILKRDIKLIAHLISHHSADADPTWLCQCLQACRYIDAVAEDVVLFNDHVAEVNPDAEPDLGALREPPS
jgi:hypothetical protein